MTEQLPVPKDPYRAPNTPAVALAGGITMKRKLLALAIAALSDALSLVAEFAPPVQWIVDGVTAAALFAVLGFRWQLLPVLAVEAVPLLAAFPTWLLVVGFLSGTTPTRAAQN